MRKIFILAALNSLVITAYTNNILVSNISLTGQNTTNKTVQIQFTLAWENSWRISEGPGNRDAAWVFIKFRKGVTGNWTHSSLTNTGQVAPTGSTISIGLLTPANAFNIGTNPGLGAFIFRSANGSGTFTVSNAQLRWHYGQDGLTDVDQVDLQVFAIEMVYVPTGAFAAGDGAVAPLANRFTLTTINTANATITPSGTGSIGGQAGGFPTGQTAPTNASWPNGYNAFYCMKYELSQQGYVDFLNTLTRSQQNKRVASAIENATFTSLRFVMCNKEEWSDRNAIACSGEFSNSAPIRFYCDYNENFVGGEPDDGKELACNFLNWADLAAYLAWAGLRPLTEMEFEKCARGSQVSFPNEYAWGNRNISMAITTYSHTQKTFQGEGTASERVNPDANVGFGNLYGPLRNGAFATEAGGRENAGAGYYGAMELSGNLWERFIGLNHSQGRSFLGTNGNGKLDLNGNPGNNPDWPPATGEGVIIRGGSFDSNLISDLEVSNREYLNTFPTRNRTFSGRGGRSAQ